MRQPWHDCPKCKRCDGPLSSRAPAGFYPHMNVRCMACGRQDVVGEPDLVQAIRADEAWDAERHRLGERGVAIDHHRVLAAKGHRVCLLCGVTLEASDAA